MSRRSNDILGLDGVWPRPGWVVLDAARDTQFTGQITFDSAPPVDVYFDRGRAYLAERRTDPPIGAVLVDNDALDAAQLARGTVRAGEHDHIGRLFDLVPEVDRLRVLVTLELLTEELVAWVAGQSVRLATPAPYLMHPSGAHRWESAEAVAERMSPVMAASGLAEPVGDTVATMPVVPELERLGDDMSIQWSDPSGAATIAAVLAPALAVPVGGPVGSAESLADPDATPVEIPAPDDPTIDRFEVVWPTGEVDRPDGTEIAAGLESPSLGAAEADGAPGATADADVRVDVSDVADEVVLAVRQALAAIEADAVASRPARSSSAPVFHYGGDAGGGGSVATEVRPTATVVGRTDPGSVPPPPNVATRGPVDPLVRPPAGPAIPGLMGNPPTLPPVPPPPPPMPDRRRSALRRLVDNLRGR
jgi:hypothetical protein